MSQCSLPAGWELQPTRSIWSSYGIGNCLRRYGIKGNFHFLATYMIEFFASIKKNTVYIYISPLSYIRKQ